MNQKVFLQSGLEAPQSSVNDNTETNNEIKSKTKKSRASIGKNNKAKGHKAERTLVAQFKELGYQHASTTRMSSRILDHCGIDINFIPIIVQSKAGKQAGLKPRDELKYIEDRMKELLPPDSEWHSKIKVVVQTLPCTTKARTEYDSIVSLTLKDLLRLVELAFPLVDNSKTIIS